MSPAAHAVGKLDMAWLAAALCLTGCSAAERSAGSPAAASPTAVAIESPESGPIAASVDQFRDGYASGTIVLQLTDTGGAPFTAVRAELSDLRFAQGTLWTGSTAFTSGQTTSLPVVLAPPRCPTASGATAGASADDGAPVVVVRLADGTEERVRAADPHDVLARLHAAGCFEATVATAAALSLASTLGPGRATGTAVLTLDVGPPSASAPAPGSLPSQAPSSSPAAPRLAAVGGTTLLEEVAADPWPRGVVLTPGTEVRLAVRPARCDPHAVAEDKVGTLIPLTVEAGGTSGVVKVAAPPALRAAIYAFVGATCGWPAG